MEEEISLRPVVLKPLGNGFGASNPFASFGKGAGFSIKAKKGATSALVADETTVKKDGKIIKYNKQFLMEFMERYNKCPLQLQQLNLPEIVISEEQDRDQQRQVLLRVAEELDTNDTRDWRARAAPAAPAAGGRDNSAWDQPTIRSEPVQPRAEPTSQPQPAQQAPAQQAPAQKQQAPAADQAMPKIVKAADVGLQAYRPGATLSAEERALRQIKGILNKLTPEKFERLLQQLLEVITTADVLRHTIALVFENAVEQPTYCAMYAELCLKLSKELPSFPPPAGGDRPITFRQILLNTCQDEFEGAAEARENLQRLESSAREDAERTVKKRVMGNMRLISELYKKDMVKDWIMTTCIEDLLTTHKGRVPHEDSIEAACEMISTAGASLAKSDRKETVKKLDDVFKMLTKLAEDRSISSRIRFVIKDVHDLRRNNWVARREVFTAKKLDEVRAQAEAELGLISSTIAAALPTLPAQTRLGGSAASDVPLIPPLRSGGEAEAWGLFPPLRSEQQQAQASGPGRGSALLGDFQPIQRAPAPQQQQAQQPAAPAPEPQQAAASRPAAGGKALSEEDLKRKTEGLFAEYTSTLDKKEALQCVRELNSPEYMGKLVEVGLDQALNALKEKDQEALVELLLHLHAEGAVPAAAVLEGLATYTVQLEDLSLDIPKLPQVLGNFVGRAVLSNVMGLDALPQLLEGDSSVEPKRAFAAAALSEIKAKRGESGLGELCSAANIHAEGFLKADPEFDGDAPSVQDWLKAEGLQVVPL